MMEGWLLMMSKWQRCDRGCCTFYGKIAAVACTY